MENTYSASHTGNLLQAESQMNVRLGFYRLALAVFSFGWACFLSVVIFSSDSISKEDWQAAGVVSVIFVALCSGIAWIYRGFFGPPSP